MHDRFAVLTRARSYRRDLPHLEERWGKQQSAQQASRWPYQAREDSSSKRGQCITRGEAARVMHASAPRADGSQTLTVRLRMQRLTLCRRLGSAISGLCCIAFRAAQKTLICCDAEAVLRILFQKKAGGSEQLHFRIFHSL